MGLSIPLQCLLQTFFSQNALTETNLRALIAELSHDGDRAAVTEDVLNGTVANLNADISPLDFELRRTIDQQAGAEGQHIWVLCNTTSDALTQLATVHPQNEVAYFKVLLNQIFVTNNTRQRETLAVASMDAVREAGRAGLTKAQAEGCLRQFVAETWLQLSPRGYYSLTARTLMELQGYLRETYNDTDHDEDGEVIKTCHACRELLTMGFRCPNLDCACRFHYKCHEAFFRRASLRCPVCREVEWDRQGIGHVGERAARQGSPPSTEHHHGNHDADSVEDGDGDD